MTLRVSRENTCRSNRGLTLNHLQRRKITKPSQQVGSTVAGRVGSTRVAERFLFPFWSRTPQAHSSKSSDHSCITTSFKEKDQMLESDDQRKSEFFLVRFEKYRPRKLGLVKSGHYWSGRILNRHFIFTRIGWERNAYLISLLSRCQRNTQDLVVTTILRGSPIFALKNGITGLLPFTNLTTLDQMLKCAPNSTVNPC